MVKSSTKRKNRKRIKNKIFEHLSLVTNARSLVSKVRQVPWRRSGFELARLVEWYHDHEASYC